MKSKFWAIIINKLFCSHEWSLFREASYWGDSVDRPERHKDIVVCKKCGKIKIIKY